MKRNRPQPALHPSRNKTGIPDLYEIGVHDQDRTRINIWPHIHPPDRLEICYVARGRKRFEVDGRVYIVTGGHVLLVFPGETHKSFGVWHEEGMDYFVCLRATGRQTSFMGIRSSDAARLPAALLQVKRRTFMGRPRMQDSLDAAIAAFKDAADPLARIKLHTNALMFLLDVLNCAARPIDPMRRDQQHVLDVIEERLDNPPSVREMAAIAALSPSRFKTVFRQQAGMSPMDYVQRARIDKASEYLREHPEATVTETAFTLGFKSSQHFAMVFKRYTGMTPVEFRDAVSD